MLLQNGPAFVGRRYTYHIGWSDGNLFLWSTDGRRAEACEANCRRQDGAHHAIGVIIGFAQRNKVFLVIADEGVGRPCEASGCVSIHCRCEKKLILISVNCVVAFRILVGLWLYSIKGHAFIPASAIGCCLSAISTSVLSSRKRAVVGCIVQ